MGCSWKCCQNFCIAHVWSQWRIGPWFAEWVTFAKKFGKSGFSAALMTSVGYCWPKWNVLILAMQFILKKFIVAKLINNHLLPLQFSAWSNKTRATSKIFTARGRWTNLSKLSSRRTFRASREESTSLTNSTPGFQTSRYLKTLKTCA